MERFRSKLNLEDKFISLYSIQVFYSKYTNTYIWKVGTYLKYVFEYVLQIFLSI